MSTPVPSTPLRKTPLQSTSQPLSTPVHSRDSASSQADPRNESRDDILKRLGLDMGPFVVGPISAKTFLAEFMPPPSAGSRPSRFKKGMFRDLMQMLTQKEQTWYNVFINIVSQHLRNSKVINTSNASGESPNTTLPHALMPDCSVFWTDYENPEKFEKQHFDFNHAEFIIEFKKGNKFDPFVDNPSDTGHSKNNDSSKFLSSDRDARKVLGQITSYATAILGTQYRTHLFMVFVVDKHARLMRWDRAGAVVTELIPFDTDPSLFDFLTRYDVATRDVRGHDSTVTFPSQDEIERAKRVIVGWDKEEAFLTVTMSDQRFIIPRFQARGYVPTGRWTRSSVAFDVQKERQVYLKDSWRVMIPSFTSEGDTYRRLEGVPNIPPCVLSGNVGKDTYHETQTQHVLKNHVRDPDDWKLTPYRHYRIVLGVVGRRLEDFTCTRELVNAMYAALKAHEAAHKIGVLHRDISSGNILIVGPDELHPDQQDLKIEGGILIDWDLSKFVNPSEEHHGARHHERTGTWMFMAADLVASPGILQTFVHDLESFFWVLLWMVLNYVKTNWEGHVLSSSYKPIFSSDLYTSAEGVLGGVGKMDFLQNDRKMDRFQIVGNPMFTELLNSLKRTVSSRYDSEPKESSNNPETSYEDELKKYNIRLEYMKDHSTMLREFAKALSPSNVEKWPGDDKPTRQPFLPSVSEVRRDKYTSFA